MKPMLTLALAASLTATTPVLAEEKKSATIAVGTTVLDVSYPMLTLPLSLGFWAEDGLDVTVEPVGASLQAVQLMVAGNADFAQINANVIVQSNVTNNLPLRMVMSNTVNDWNVAVLASSGLSKIEDLRGKTIGVFSLATGGVALLNSYMVENGMKPDDVSLLPVGLGAAPVEALRNGQVDGLLYWGAATARFENAGLDLVRIAPSDWREMPDYSLSTLQSKVESDPELLVRLVRGMAKAEIFAIANPECAVRLHWKHYPDTRPTGADEKTLLEWDTNNIMVAVESFQDAFALNGGKYWGEVSVEGIGRVQSFLAGAGVIASQLPPETYLANIPDFYARANDFDAEAIRAAAKACEFDL